MILKDAFFRVPIALTIQCFLAFVEASRVCFPAPSFRSSVAHWAFRVIHHDKGSCHRQDPTVHSFVGFPSKNQFSSFSKRTQSILDKFQCLDLVVILGIPAWFLSSIWYLASFSVCPSSIFNSQYPRACPFYGYAGCAFPGPTSCLAGIWGIW